MPLYADTIEIPGLPGYTARMLQPEHIRDLEKLYLAVSGRNKSPDYFLKKYHTAWTGISYCGSLVYDSQETVAAFIGVIPCFLRFGEYRELAGQVTDIMTHPAHRGRGIYHFLSDHLLTFSKAAGIRLLFGFPNEQSYPLLVQEKNWQHLSTMDRFEIPVNGGFLQRVMQKLSGSKLKQIQKRSMALQPFKVPGKGLPNQLLAEGFAGIERDQSYLEYKSYNNPELIRTGKTTVWLGQGPGFRIGDMAYINKEDFPVCMKEIIKIAEATGETKISFYCSAGTNLHSLFTELYKPLPSFPVLAKNIGTSIPLEKLRFTFSDIDIF